MDATDNRWRQAEGGWDRLRWARLAAGYERAKDFADSIGMKEGTYRAYERMPDSSKHSRLDDQAAMRFAHKLKVRWEWLLTGEGTPWQDSARAMAMTPGKDRLRKLSDQLDEDRAAKLADAIEAMLKVG